MHSLAAFILRGRMQAVLVAVVTAVMSLVLPPFSYISGATMAIVTLRNGVREGLFIVVAAAVVMAVLGLLSSMNGGLVKSFVTTLVLAAWLPVVLCALVLRITRSLAMAVLAASMIVLIAMSGFYLAVDDVAAWWQQVLSLVVQPMLESSQAGLTSSEAEKIVVSMAGIMTGLLAASMLYSIILNLFLARWWQSLLFNPNGFRAEFHALHLDGRSGLLLLLVVGLSMFTTGTLADYANNLLWIFLAIYSLQGLALLHAVSAALGLHKGWIIGLYAMMMLMLPLIVQIIMVLSALGLTDSVVDFRRRFRLAERQGKQRDDEEN